MNPYAPPTADVSKPEPSNRRVVAFVLLGLCALQLLWFILFARGYWELVRTGAVSVIGGFSGLLGCVLLYAGAARFAANAERGNRLFIASFALLILSLKGWELQYLLFNPCVFAAGIAVAGWWFSRRRERLVSADF